MRYLFISVLFTFLYTDAQQSNNVAIKVQYSETITYRSPIVNKCIGTLYIQNEFSNYKSEFKNREGNGTNKEGEITINSSESEFSTEVFINSKVKELTENLYENKFLKKSFSVYEELPKMKWVFLKGEKKLNSLTCKKAQTTFRGRTYTAWYTESIPNPYGPWKFNGLPGLILSVEDHAGVYNWEVINIKYPYKGTEVNLKDTYSKRFTYNKISFKEFDEKLIMAINDKIKTVKARNTNRDGMSFGFGYSTFLHKEPINEWRSQMDFK